MSQVNPINREYNMKKIIMGEEEKFDAHFKE
jgi:hypothetical protein